MKKHLLKSIFISLILVLGVSNAWAEPWLCRSTAGGKIATKTVGDKLNNGNEWNYTYTTNGGWSNETDIQVYVGTSTSSCTAVTASWKSDDGNNKNVAANIGGVHFDKSGKWYAVGKYTAGKKTAYTTKNSEWTNDTTFSMGSNDEPYWEVTPPAVSNFKVTVSGYLSGEGTSSDPYVIQYGKALTLALSGDKAKTDANSTLQYYTSDKWNTTTSRTISNITSTTTQSVTVKMRCYNSSAKLSGTESSKTIYYRSEDIYTVTVNNDGHGTTEPSGEQSNIGQVTGLAISATPTDNYEFVNWTIKEGDGSFEDANSTSTTFKPTSAATIQANFRSTATYSLTVQAGEGIESVTGSTDPVTLNSPYEITATPKTGYTFEKWTADNAENATFASATSANTTVTVKNGSVIVTASAVENMSTLTTSNNYDAGDPNYAAPSATVSKIGIATTAKITATEAGNGYTFTGWTLDNCVRTDAGTADATTITVKSNGDGVAAKVTANYEQNVVYFVNTKGWSTVKVYAWNDGGAANAEWPGVALTDANIVKQIGGCDVYKYVPGANYAKVIFNNGSEKTDDLAWQNGKYYVYNSENSVGANDWYDESEVESVLPRYKTIYLNTGGSGLWDQDDAKFFVHVWGGSADDLDAQMTNLENEIYQVEVAASHAEIIFLRQSKETSGVVWNDQDGLYNKTGNLTIPADKNCYTITGWGGNEGKWSNLEYYVTGNKALVGGEGWKANEIKMAISNNEWSNTFEALEKGIEYQFKITRNGTWDKSWGYNALYPIVENTLECKDNNIGFILADKGNVTITFDGENIELTTTSSFAAPVYTLVGDAAITGCHWDVNSVENQMVQDATDKNKFTLVKTVTAAAGEYDYKAIRNYSYDWEVAPGEKLKIEKNGTGKITYTLNVDTKKLTATVSDWVEEVVAQEVTLVGIGENRTFTEADDHKITSVAVELEANRVYTFEIIVNSVYMKNNGIMWRGNCTDWTFKSEENNAHIVTDLAGTYTFTWTYDGNKLSVTYPEGSNVPAPIFLGGEMNGWDWTKTLLIPSTDSKTASAIVNLTEAKKYEFKIRQGDDHLGNNGTMTRENNNQAWTFAKADNNCTITADIIGDYVFTWNYEKSELIVTYPEIVTPPTIIGEGENNLNDGEIIDVQVNRQFATGNIYTLSLPFALDNVEEIFGNGTSVYQFSALTKNASEELVLYFDKVTSIAAATPYLIEPAQAVDGFTVENATISTTPNDISFTVDATKVTMKPILSAAAGSETNGEYWLAADRYLYNNENTLLSLRALFNISTVSGMPPRCRVALGENAETGVDNIINGENTTIKVIENGQLIIIRDGIKYNAQGQKL